MMAVFVESDLGADTGLVVGAERGVSNYGSSADRVETQLFEMASVTSLYVEAITDSVPKHPVG